MCPSGHCLQIDLVLFTCLPLPLSEKNWHNVSIITPPPSLFCEVNKIGGAHWFFGGDPGIHVLRLNVRFAIRLVFCFCSSHSPWTSIHEMLNIWLYPSIYIYMMAIPGAISLKTHNKIRTLIETRLYKPFLFTVAIGFIQIVFVEGSLNSKLPTIWRVEKQMKSR